MVRNKNFKPQMNENALLCLAMQLY